MSAIWDDNKARIDELDTERRRTHSPPRANTDVRTHRVYEHTDGQAHTHTHSMKQSEVMEKVNLRWLACSIEIFLSV